MEIESDWWKRERLANERLAKIIGICATIIIDFILLIGTGIFLGYVHLGLFEFSIGFGALFYATCGNKITYNMLKYSILKFKAPETYQVLHPVRMAMRGDLAKLGIALFVIMTFIFTAVFGSSYLNVSIPEHGELLKFVIVMVVLACIVPLLIKFKIL